MINPLVLRAFSATLALFPVEWALWIIDSEERYEFVDGSCLDRLGMNPAERLGKPVAETNAANPDLLAQVRTAMKRPTTGHVVMEGQLVLISGAPSEGGGCVQLAVVVGPVERQPERAPACPVLELQADVPQVNAVRGDILVVDAQMPGRVGVYRVVETALLPESLASEVRRLERSTTPAARPGDAQSRGAAPRQERATHLHLLP